MNLHFMGISGSGMSGVASLASKMGYQVTGCDLKNGGHDIKHLEGIDLLVVSPAVLYQNKNHPEFEEAQRKGMVISWEEFVGKYLTKNKKVVAVAGTHGKSTTTAMVGKLLEDAKLDPTVVIGANVPEWGGNSRFGKGKYFVIEADEFNDNFLNYNADIIILNNIEFDHPDYFKDEDQVFDSFKKFINNLRGDKVLIANISDKGVQKLLKMIATDNVRLVTYDPSNSNINLNLQVSGQHNVTNALGVVVLGKLLGIDVVEVTTSLENFSGIGRRMELIGATQNGIKIYDDYAHHPTAIKTTLEGLREKELGKTIWAVVEPHGYKRTKALLDLYKDAFNSSDKVVIGPIFKARDEVDSQISPDVVAGAVPGNKDVKAFENEDEMISYVVKNIDDNDIVLVMGAGNSNKWAKEIFENIYKPSFKDLTTLKVGGQISHFASVKNKEEVGEIVKYAKANNLPIFTIGGGSDILVSDNRFEGLVIKYVGENIKFDGNLVTADAGINWDKFVEETVNKGLQGVECLSGIPGTVGAAPIQNIGAYGQELKDTFFKLVAYDIEKEEFREFDNEECQFGYRESIFKRKENWQKFIITEVTFKLNKGINGEVKYDSLKSYITSSAPTLKELREAVLKVRSEKLEDPRVVPNAGSFFKNPIIEGSKKKELETKYPDIKIYPFEDKFKIPAAFLIEKVGWKGKNLGNVSVSSKHALVITNPGGNGNFEDIKRLADKIMEDVHKEFGIELEPEVQFIEFNY